MLDETQGISAICEGLSSIGFITECSDDVEKALALDKSSLYDGILMQTNDVDHCESLVRTIRDIALHKDTSIVCFLPSSQTGMVSDYRKRMDVDAIFATPFDLRAFEEILADKGALGTT